ncbi:hypothetical protein JOD97_001677 [Duganella sp. 1411]|uniref:glycosyltransferase family 2 protein n=1 Tax=Duganella sp. 1411 TaxID=2806572 RepID=UPI001AE1E1E3|nr:glycosyltransferase family 2 protein [Duganella sp. 1411]MBP1203663.1 hypothetical protein [Duganella sp. 1411]
MLKYCLLNSGITGGHQLAIGAAQWVKAFRGALVEPGALAQRADIERYDIVHVILCPENYALIERLRVALGEKSKTRLILSLDTSAFDRHASEDGVRLSEIHSKADLVFANDHATVLRFERVIKRPIFELTHPADLQTLCVPAEKNNRTAVFVPPARFSYVKALLLKLIAPAFTGHCGGCKIDIITGHLKNNPAALEKLASYTFICFDSKFKDHDDELLYLTSRAAILIGGSAAEVAKRCFSLTAHSTYRQMLKTLSWLASDANAADYALEYAADKLEYYNLGNSANRMLNIINNHSDQRVLLENKDSWHDDPNRVVYLDAIPHIFGPTRVAYEKNQFVVVCLVKNGDEYLPSFLRHYRKLGARHFFFIDNESTDDTLRTLRQQPDVTIYTTSLKHKKYESEVRRTIIEKHCVSRWCLCVDIDELFEYPGSERNTMAAFLDYLNTHRYTAVVAYMLDMFATEQNATSPYLEDIYTSFDLSDIQWGGYFSGFEAFNDHNVLPVKTIGNYYGGVRQKHIKTGESKFLLTKHPLIFLDHHIEPVTMPHFCNKSRIADVTCLLKHYKLTTSLKKNIDEGISNDTFSFIIKDQISAYLSMIEENNFCNLSNKYERYAGVNALVDAGFLYTSESYKNYSAEVAV